MCKRKTDKNLIKRYDTNNLKRVRKMFIFTQNLFKPTRHLQNPSKIRWFVRVLLNFVLSHASRPQKQIHEQKQTAHNNYHRYRQGSSAQHKKFKFIVTFKIRK